MKDGTYLAKSSICHKEFGWFKSIVVRGIWNPVIGKLPRQRLIGNKIYRAFSYFVFETRLWEFNVFQANTQRSINPIYVILKQVCKPSLQFFFPKGDYMFCSRNNYTSQLSNELNYVVYTTYFRKLIQKIIMRFMSY